VQKRKQNLTFVALRSRNRCLVASIFIGQFCNKCLLKETVIRYCIFSRLELDTDDKESKNPLYHDAGDSEMDEEDREALCHLVENMVSAIDGPAAASFINITFVKIKWLSTSKDLPSRPRFMNKDLLDLQSIVARNKRQ
jgi:hypothetical protein